MFRFHIKSKYCCRGNWITNLSVLLCNINIIISESCNETRTGLGFETYTKPHNWPCQWNQGIIPFCYDYFSMSPKRLVSLVRKGHSYLEKKSCLVFQEFDPRLLARSENFTYLYYSYSEVLENCCLPFFSESVGKRLVLITPICSLPHEIAHATLHGLGLTHSKKELFPEIEVVAVLFPGSCGLSDREDIMYAPEDAKV